MTYDVIYRLLRNSPEIVNRVGTRIYPENAPEGMTGELIIMKWLSGEANNHLTNESDSAQPIVQIDFYSNSTRRAASGYQLVRNLLSGYGPADVEGVLDDQGNEHTVHVSAINLLRPGFLLIDEPADASDKWVYRFSADFEVFHSQDVPTHV